MFESHWSVVQSRGGGRLIGRRLSLPRKPMGLAGVCLGCHLESNGR